ncbi:hypothetical protein [Kineosporia babensis]|uniref:Uncharacterized protein n=1 Tax=Kineosporia babensis TaxID=499548 RepID=A0A9X1NHT3_9ACTN|nr:hypothetical protein [Kineosporia babensis]MCD5314300.1 hypothetical protein [Kineosporia babensis]
MSTTAPQLTTSLSQHFVLRLAIATAMTAFSGGTTTACMFIAMGENDGNPVRSAFGVVPALLVLVTVLWWLVAAHSRQLRTPSNRQFAMVALAGAAVALISQVWSELRLAEGGFTMHNIGILMLLMIIGSFLALVPAAICLVVLAGAVLGMRSAGRRIGTRNVQVLATLLAMVVTAGYTLLLVRALPGYSPNELLLITGLSTLLAGACAAIAVRWSLSYRRV